MQRFYQLFFMVIFLCLFMVLAGISVEKTFAESSVVSVTSQPLEAEEAATGTGIVVDKDNGLILTARHGVYQGNPTTYEYKNLFRNIIVRTEQQELLDSYVVHLSPKYDLAIVKVDKQFSSEATFLDETRFLQKKAPVEYEGYPDGQYGIYKGSIANTLEDYLTLDMSIAAGMSGGPIYASQEGWFVDKTGIAGIVLLKQAIGGNAIRTEIVNKYLAEALPEARKVQKFDTQCICFQELFLTPTQTKYVKERDSKIYSYIKLNDEEIFKSETIPIENSMIQWSCRDENTLELSVLPGDKLEIGAWEIPSKLFSIRSKLFTFTHEKLPQAGLPPLDSTLDFINADKDANSIVFGVCDM